MQAVRISFTVFVFINNRCTVVFKQPVALPNTSVSINMKTMRLTKVICYYRILLDSAQLTSPPATVYGAHFSKCKISALPALGNVCLCFCFLLFCCLLFQILQICYKFELLNDPSRYGFTLYPSTQEKKAEERKLEICLAFVNISVSKFVAFLFARPDFVYIVCGLLASVLYFQQKHIFVQYHLFF